jgi:putative inorganic carbon (hco3(-)) transporter
MNPVEVMQSMERCARKPPSGGAVIAVVLALSIGSLFGLALLLLTDMEARWLVYMAGGLLLLAAFFTAADQENFLWGLLIFSLQFDVSIRFMYGHAGSDGFVFPLPVIVALGFLVFAAFSGKMRHWKPLSWGGPLAWPIAAMLVTMLAATAMSAERFLGMSALLVQVELYLIFWLVLNGVKTEQRFRQVITYLLVSLAIQSAIYYLQSALGITFSLTGSSREAGELPRPGGTVATGPHGFANFMLPLLFVGVSLILGSYRLPNARRWHIWTVSGMGLVALVLTLTRAAWGAFAIGVLWIAFSGYRLRTVAFRKLVILAASVAVIAVAASPLIVARLEGAPFDKSYNERKALMEMAVEVIKQHPVFGVGPGAYAATYKQYLSGELAQRWQSTVHNHYLLRTAEAGFLGGVAFFSLLVAAFAHTVKLSRSARPAFRSFGMAAGAIVLASCFEMYWDMWTPFTTHSIFWVILALTVAAERMNRSRASLSIRTRAPAVANTTFRQHSEFAHVGEEGLRTSTESRR